MRVAVVGGGINGIMTAWDLAERGCEVTLHERSGLMQATSSASSKMLHGGIRYLEHGQFGLVRDSLQERAWWLEQAPDLARRFPLVIPVVEGGPRSQMKLGFGVKLYDWLARGSGFPASRWLDKQELPKLSPALSGGLLLGAWEYWDAQMDDLKLGLWAADRAKEAGADIRTNCQVSKVSVDGTVVVDGSECRYDCIVNVAGPWAKKLLDQSRIPSSYDLTLVRGSHLVVDRETTCGWVLQNDDGRIVFLLPRDDGALLGTTEVMQETPEAVPPAGEEVDYLLHSYNSFFGEPISRGNILSSFSGVRPIVRGSGHMSKASREHAIERRRKLVTVFGGKWTTSRLLARSVSQVVMSGQ